MINAVRGRYVESDGSTVVILTASGLEYSLECSQNTISTILSKTPEERNNLRIYTYLAVREDAMLLYGFADTAERNCFLQLITVNGIGAKGAIKILSSVTVPEFIRMLDTQDVKRLAKIPGVGQKTGQKLILQLRNVLVMQKEDETASSAPQRKRASGEFDDIVDAFVEMGHDRKRVREKVDKLLAENQLILHGQTKEKKEEFLFQTLIKGL